MVESRERDSNRLVGGILIFATGLVFLLERIRIIRIHDAWRLWPVSLIVMGLVHLLRGRRDRGVGWGLVFVLEGFLFLGVHYGWAGLDWSNFWPILIMIVGFGLVTDYIFGIPKTPRSQEGESR